MADVFYLAQVNVARLRTDDQDALRDFFDLSDEVNAAAEAFPGFVWKPEEALQWPDGDDVLATISVWRSPAALKEFIYTGVHQVALKRRREWFAGMNDAHLALWWIPQTTRPTVFDARDRLNKLRVDGPTPQAFPLGTIFPPPSTSSRCGEW